MSPRRAARFAASVAVVGLVAASCGGGTDSSEPAATDPAPTAVESSSDNGDTVAEAGNEAVTSDPAAPAPEPDVATTETPATDAPATETPATEPPATDAPAPAPEILQFTAPLVGGGEIDAASLAGKATVFWFWAPT